MERVLLLKCGNTTHTHKLNNQDTFAGVKGNDIPQNLYLLAHDGRDTDLGGQPKQNLEKAPSGISTNGPTARIRVTSSQNYEIR